MAQNSSSSVWDIAEGEIRRPGVVHIVILALLTGIGIVVGTFGSLAVPIGFVSAFWPGQAVQSIGAVWFGWWGGLASALFPLISNSLSGSAPLPVSIMYLPANLLQGMVAGWAFRYFKTDPSLKSQKDWIVWIVFGALLPNAIGAGWGTTVLVAFKMITPEAQLTSFLGWFIGNTLPTIVLGSLLLKFVSPLVVRARSFCKGLWA
jgi:integral membrane sensor domain MASE1